VPATIHKLDEPGLEREAGEIYPPHELPQGLGRRDVCTNDASRSISVAPGSRSASRGQSGRSGPGMSPEYRGITSTCPGDTGNESKIATAKSFAQGHSASGMAEKCEGNGEAASGRMAAVYEPDGQRWSLLETKRELGLETKDILLYTPKTMSVDIPAELGPFVERLIAERRFLTESEVLAEGLRLLQSQDAAA